MLVIKHLIVHYLHKNQRHSETSLELSDELLAIDDAAYELIKELSNRYSKQNRSKVTYAKFGSPSNLFSTEFDLFNTADSDVEFINFSRRTITELEALIKNIYLAKGGYVVFANFESTQGNNVGIYIIREKKGVLFSRDETGRSYKINDATHIDFEKIAMGCQIDKDKYVGNSGRYLSFIDSRKSEVSKFFTDWISTDDNVDNVSDTKELYKALSNIDPPLDEQGVAMSKEELLNKAYNFIKEQANRMVDVEQLGVLLYGTSNSLVDYIEENNIEISGQFQADQKVLTKFSTIRVSAGSISLSFPMKLKDKIILDANNPDIITIHSAALARKLRDENPNF